MCWNCSCERLGSEESHVETEQDSGLADSPVGQVAERATSLEADQASEPVHTGQCAVCGSTRIIPNTPILDQGQHSSGYLSAAVVGDPKALIFKDYVYGKLTADICGDCGHVSICVDNPGELYEHYLRSLQ
jgi:hypothetical protein